MVSSAVSLTRLLLGCACSGFLGLRLGKFSEACSHAVVTQGYWLPFLYNDLGPATRDRDVIATLTRPPGFTSHLLKAGELSNSYVKTSNLYVCVCIFIFFIGSSMVYPPSKPRIEDCKGPNNFSTSDSGFKLLTSWTVFYLKSSIHIPLALDLVGGSVYWILLDLESTLWGRLYTNSKRTHPYLATDLAVGFIMATRPK